MSFKVTLVGDVLVERKLANIADKITNWEPIWPKVRQWFYQTNAETFQTEGHGTWKPLRKATIERRLKLGFGGPHPILVMDGQLKESLTRPGAPGSYLVETKTKIELGTSNHHAMFHQKGTKRMPPRPPLIFGFRSLPGLRKIINGYIHEIAQEK